MAKSHAAQYAEECAYISEYLETMAVKADVLEDMVGWTLTGEKGKPHSSLNVQYHDLRLALSQASSLRATLERVKRNYRK